MILLGLGMAAVAVLLWGANAFSRASIGNIKGLLAWITALGGLSLAAMLFLTGRGAAAIGGLIFLAPLAWSLWQESQLARLGARRGGPRPGPSPGGSRRMSRTEALAVLGLAEGASDSDVRAAWVRLMRAVHPDGGGTDDLASRVNQAKDVLLRGR